ncbi:MAG: MFS transporter [Rhodospirillaceae bacterium]|nr:MFS transporter [Rhodospirillaceae bacterium]
MSTAGARPDNLPSKGRAFVGLLIVGLGTVIVPLDTSVNIAFPDITDHFAIPLPAIQWVVISYVLIYVSLMLVFGKLGDLFGYKRIFLIGLMLSALAFGLCGLAPAFHWLLLARGLQGLGAALVLSCGPALATALFSEAQRGRALGAYTMMFGVGAAAGPSLGGIMVQTWGWEAVFWFRLPITLLALGAMPLLRPAQGAKRTGSFDLFGAVLLALGLGALLGAMNQVQSSLLNAFVIALLGIVALAVFGWREIRAPEPIVPLAVFRRLDFTMLNVVNSLVNLVGFSSMLLVPYYLVRVTDYSLTVSGLILAAGPLGLAISAPLGGWLLSARPWASRLALLGAIMVGVATAVMGAWAGRSDMMILALPMLVQGIGLGLFQVCILDVVTARLDIKDRGVAGSLAMVTRTVGVVMGAPCLSLLFATLSRNAAIGGLNEAAAFLSAFQATFFYAGAGLLGCLGVTLLRPRLWL